MNDKYVKEFTVGERFSATGGKSARKVYITYQNDGQNLVQPNVYIYFINGRGVVTGYAHDNWLISSVNPGERRVEDAFADFDHGEPVYWTIDIR